MTFGNLSEEPTFEVGGPLIQVVYWWTWDKLKRWFGRGLWAVGKGPSQSVSGLGDHHAL